MNNDTHGTGEEGSYAFDLDGTIATYDTWKGIDHIGEPIKPMVDLIKRLHDEGKVVKILTARVSPRPEPEEKPNPYSVIGGGYCVPAYADEYHAKAMAEDGVVCESALVFYKKAEWDARDFISDWCLKNLGFLPEITHEKDPTIVEFYDDRTKQVIPNDGTLLEDITISQNHALESFKSLVDEYRSSNLLLKRRLDSKLNGFSSGLMLGSLVAVAIVLVANAISRKSNLTDVEIDLHNAVNAYIHAKGDVL